MTLLQQLLINQFEASLAMLAHCVVGCPAECWQAPVVRYPFSQVVFHTLFPKSGRYKAWIQFQRAGKLSTVSFTFRVLRPGETVTGK